jgi:hypothetical protein
MACHLNTLSVKSHAIFFIIFVPKYQGFALGLMVVFIQKFFHIFLYGTTLDANKIFDNKLDVIVKSKHAFLSNLKN